MTRITYVCRERAIKELERSLFEVKPGFHLGLLSLHRWIPPSITSCITNNDTDSRSYTNRYFIINFSNEGSPWEVLGSVFPFFGVSGAMTELCMDVLSSQRHADNYLTELRDGQPGRKNSSNLYFKEVTEYVLTTSSIQQFLQDI